MFPALLLPGSRQSVTPRLPAAFAPCTRGAGIGSQHCSTSASDRRDSSQDWTGRVGFGQCAVRVFGRAHGAFRQHQARRLLYCRFRGWAAARRAQVPGNGGLTSRSSRCRFAARLNSGVRPCFPQCRSRVLGALQHLAHLRHLHFARAGAASAVTRGAPRLRTAATLAQVRSS